MPSSSAISNSLSWGKPMTTDSQNRSGEHRSSLRRPISKQGNNSHSDEFLSLMDASKDLPAKWYKASAKPLFGMKMTEWFETFLSRPQTHQDLLQCFSHLDMVNVEPPQTTIARAPTGAPGQPVQALGISRLPPLPRSYLETRQTLLRDIEWHRDRLEVKTPTQKEKDTSLENRQEKTSSIQDTSITSSPEPEAHRPAEGTSSSPDTLITSNTIDPNGIQPLSAIHVADEDSLESMQERKPLEDNASKLVHDDPSHEKKKRTHHESSSSDSPSSPLNCHNFRPQWRTTEPATSMSGAEDVDLSLMSNGLGESDLSSADRNVIAPLESVVLFAAEVGTDGHSLSSYDIEEFTIRLAHGLRASHCSAFMALSLTRLFITEHARSQHRRSLEVTISKVKDPRAVTDGVVEGLSLKDEEHFEIVWEPFTMPAAADLGQLALGPLDDFLNAFMAPVNGHAGYVLQINLPKDALLPSPRHLQFLFAFLYSKEPNQMLFNILAYTEEILFRGGTLKSLKQRISTSKISHTNSPWMVDPSDGLPFGIGNHTEGAPDLNPIGPSIPSTLLRSEDRRYVLSSRVLDIHIKAICMAHPNLSFLNQSDPFVKNYINTVRYRMEFYLNDSLDPTGITLDALRNTSIATDFEMIESVPDNLTHRNFFGYEAFYVVFFRFFEINVDNRLVLGFDDFKKYENYCLLQRAVDRIFDPTFGFCESPVEMTYREYLNFKWMDEDKLTTKSINFWFRFFDLNGDGVVSADEIEHFFCETVQRVYDSCQDTLLFSDMLCQLNDAITPEVSGEFTLEEWHRYPKVIASLVEQIVSYAKHCQNDSRDPYSMLTDAESYPYDTEWERYIRTNYTSINQGEGY